MPFPLDHRMRAPPLAQRPAGVARPRGPGSNLGALYRRPVLVELPLPAPRFTVRNVH